MTGMTEAITIPLTVQDRARIADLKTRIGLQSDQAIVRAAVLALWQRRTAVTTPRAPDPQDAWPEFTGTDPAAPPVDEENRTAEEDDDEDDDQDQEATSLHQIGLIRVILRHLGRCGRELIEPRHLNAVIRAADEVIAEMTRESVPATPGMGVAAWLASDDTGISSLAMLRHLAPLAGLSIPVLPYRSALPGRGTPSVPAERTWPPSDPADLGRCLRLLEAVPTLRPHLPRLADLGPVWAALVARWDELAAIYQAEARSGQAPRCFALMTTITDAAERQRRPQEANPDAPSQSTP